MLERRLRKAQDEGNRLLLDLGMREPAHIDPVITANELGIEIVTGRLHHATARIFRFGTKGARIRVSDEIVHPGRRRFSIAHEVGHFVLGHELPRESDLARFVSRACERTRSPDEDPEREADVFATAHLMPDWMMRKACEVSPVSLDVVRDIAKRFTLSPVASARRFVELTSERCALVYSERGVVRRVRKSASFAWHIPDGMRLTRESLAFDYFAKGKLDERAQQVPADAWLHDIRSDVADVEIIEHAELIPEPGWGGVLSLLWVPEAAAAKLGEWEGASDARDRMPRWG
jgi:hypothetical protein